MADLEEQLRAVTGEAAAARAERDRVIAAAASSGLSVRRIGDLTGLSHQRVHQIVREQKGAK